LLAVTVVGMTAACGKKAPPRPPEPRGPFPPTEVRARQLGGIVEVAFGVPQARSENPAQQPVLAELVRVEYGPGFEAPPDPDAFRRRARVVNFLEGAPLEAGARMRLTDPTWRQLGDQGVGWTLRYAVRVRDRRGRPSPLVVATDLVAVVPRAPPRELVAEPTADGIRLAWRPPTSEGAYRYAIYRADVADRSFPEQPLNGQPLDTSDYLDSSVEIGKTYRYEVRSIAGDPPPYRESTGSTPVTLVAEDRFAPSAPLGLVAVQEGEAVRLFWDPGPERDVSGYRVYRRVESSSWEQIGPNRVEEPLHLDADVRSHQRMTYRVTAVDRANPPNESEPSESVELLIADERPGDAPSAEREP
jgi:hypothetical protein